MLVASACHLKPEEGNKLEGAECGHEGDAGEADQGPKADAVDSQQGELLKMEAALVSRSGGVGQNLQTLAQYFCNHLGKNY